MLYFTIKYTIIPCCWCYWVSGASWCVFKCAPKCICWTLNVLSHHWPCDQMLMQALARACSAAALQFADYSELPDSDSLHHNTDDKGFALSSCRATKVGAQTAPDARMMLASSSDVISVLRSWEPAGLLGRFNMIQTTRRSGFMRTYKGDFPW